MGAEPGIGGLSGMALIGGSSGLFGLSSSVLSQALTVRTGGGGTVSVNAPAPARDVNTLPPWDTRREQPTDEAALKAALSGGALIQSKGRYFDLESVPSDHKKLFALYQGLSKLATLARHAADKQTVDGQLAALNDRFQAGLDEVTTYVRETKLDGVTLLRGTKRASVEATVAVPRSTASYVGATAQRGAFDAPIAGLAGDEVFTIAIKKSNATTNVTVDLGLMGSTPRTIDNIASFINDTLAGQGFITRFKREKLEDGSFGFKIQGVSTEQLTFSASASTPALYIAGTSGSGSEQAGQVLKLNETGAAEPTLAFSKRIEGERGAVNARATKVDSQGNAYVLGTTESDLSDDTLIGRKDVYLRKYDSTGKLLWSRLLGASEKAEGFALAIDGQDNVVIAGRVDGDLTSQAVGGGGDSFVTKFNARGEEIFTRQIAPLREDGASALTIGADGAIYVGGYTKAAMSAGLTYGGGADAFVTKLTAGGSLLYHRQIGGTGDERTQALALASDGSLLIASAENGRGILRKFDAGAGTGAATWSLDLGALNGGAIGAIAVDGNAIYVGGTTGNPSLDAGGTASIAAPHNGGTDGFVMRIDDAGGSANAQYTTYIGTAGGDGIAGLAVKDGVVFAAGETRGALPGENRAGAVNGFAAKLDGASGNVDWLYQYGGRGGLSSAAAIAVDPNGTSVLGVLGLPRGTLDQTVSRLVTANSSVRAGTSFEIAVDGKPARKIRIDATETLRSLALKINSVLLLNGKASLTRSSDGDKLKIEAKEGTSFDLIAGPEGFDALTGLGLAPGKVINEGPKAETQSEDEAPQSKIIGLELDGRFGLATRKDAEEAVKEIDRALAQVRKAYRALTLDPLLEKMKKPAPTGPAPAFLREQLANYAAGLQRLQAGAPASVLL